MVTALENGKIRRFKSTFVGDCLDKRSIDRTIRELLRRAYGVEDVIYECLVTNGPHGNQETDGIQGSFNEFHWRIQKHAVIEHWRQSARKCKIAISKRTALIFLAVKRNRFARKLSELNQRHKSNSPISHT